MEERYASQEDVQQAERVMVQALERELGELLRGRPDPQPQQSDDQAVFGLSDKVVRDYAAASASPPGPPKLSRAQLVEMRRRLYITHSPRGPMSPLLRVEGVEDVHINGTSGYMEFGDHREPLPVAFQSEEELTRAIRWYAEMAGKHFDPSNPLSTITLRDGSRINAILRPVAKPQVITIRHQQVRRFLRLEDLRREGAIPEAAIPLLRGAVAARLNIVIAGETGAGKTTVARVFGLLIPVGERTCVLETETELWLHDLRDDCFSLEEREANVEGAGRITMQELFQRGALRQRPRRIIVGEVRGKEALDMVHAMNSGHDGSFTTVHASSPRAALNRLQVLAMADDSKPPGRVVSQMVGTGVDMVVQLGMFQRGEGAIRRLRSLSFVDQNIESPRIGPIVQEVCRYRLAEDTWSWDDDAVRFMPDKVREKFRAAGITDNELRSREMSDQ